MVCSFTVYRLTVWLALHTKSRPFKKAGWALYPANSRQYLELWVAPWNSQRAVNPKLGGDRC